MKIITDILLALFSCALGFGGFVLVWYLIYLSMYKCTYNAAKIGGGTDEEAKKYADDFFENLADARNGYKKFWARESKDLERIINEKRNSKI